MSLVTTATRTPHRARIEVGPLADVLLVLLAIWMPLVLYGRRTIDVHFAERCPKVYEFTWTVALEVLPGPAYRLNGAPLTETALRAALPETYAARPEKIISVTGHPDVTYQEVVAAMDLARGAGVRVVVVPVPLAAPDVDDVRANRCIRPPHASPLLVHRVPAARTSRALRTVANSP